MDLRHGSQFSLRRGISEEAAVAQKNLPREDLILNHERPKSQCEGGSQKIWNYYPHSK